MRSSECELLLNRVPECLTSFSLIFLCNLHANLIHFSFLITVQRLVKDSLNPSLSQFFDTCDGRTNSPSFMDHRNVLLVYSEEVLSIVQQRDFSLHRLHTEIKLGALCLLLLSTYFPASSVWMRTSGCTIGSLYKKKNVMLT